MKRDKLRTDPIEAIAPSVRQRLELLAATLLRWNRTLNLVGAQDATALWARHIDDSLQLLPLLPPPRLAAVDIGSGAGFPGLVLAIASSRHFHLVEADQRKAAFLREAARETEAAVTVHATRIETAQLPPAGLITARAVGRLKHLLMLSAPLLDRCGVCLFMKGASAEVELTEAAREWQMRVDRFASRTDAAATIFRISQIARAAAD